MGSLLIPTKPKSIYSGALKVKSVWYGNTKIWSRWDPSDHHRVGGRIFYIHNNSGNTYTFYDREGAIITTHTIDGLATAYYYDKIGTGADMFYVYDNINWIVEGKTWGKRNIDCGMSSLEIGYGKINTATMMSLTPDGTAWTWLRDTINASSVGGCNDWYIGSGNEVLAMYNSGLEPLMTRYTIWTASEYDGPFNMVTYILSTSGELAYSNRTSSTLRSVFAMRSF